MYRVFAICLIALFVWTASLIVIGFLVGLMLGIDWFWEVIK